MTCHLAAQNPATNAVAEKLKLVCFRCEKSIFSPTVAQKYLINIPITSKNHFIIINNPQNG